VFQQLGHRLSSSVSYSLSIYRVTQTLAQSYASAVDEPGLRERKKERTRQLLSETARRLFSERGFENVSVAEVAQAAEVSPATVFNYFATKEDLVYAGLEVFESQLLEAIGRRSRGESVLDAFGRFILEPRGLLATDDEAAAAEFAAVVRLIAASPALLAREQQILARYTTALAGLIARETGAPAGDVRPAVAANALIGVHRSLIEYVRERVVAGAFDRRRLAREVRRRGEAALALLRDGLDGYAVKTT
jgi:AcrR family transcriptional regulator